MKISRLLGATSAFVFVLCASSSHSALISVLGGSAYYDDQLDITWTQDANINGRDSWANQSLWAASLTIGGVSGWRLPSVDVDGSGGVIDCSSSTQAACMDNEYGHLYFYGAGTTLGSGITPASPSPFSNLVSNSYWSATESGSNAYIFRTTSGASLLNSKLGNFYAWAVYDGNAELASVPVPAAVWLFGSGLLSLVGMARRKKAA